MLNFELADTAFHHIDLGGHGVNFDTQSRCRFVDEVDGLVWQKPRGDVSVGQHRRGNEGTVLNTNAVMHLVALLEAAQDGNGVFHRGFSHVHLLEPALQGRVLFDVLTELIERGCPDHAQLAAGQHWLEHVAGIHGPFGGPGTHHGMHFVDECDDLTLGVGDLFEYSFQPLLELPAVLGPGHHGGQIQ